MMAGYDQPDSGGDIGGGGDPTPTPAPSPPPPPTPAPTPTPPPPPAPTPDPVPTSPQAVGSTIAAGSGVAALVIGLSQVATQKISVQLGEQTCKIAVYQKTTGLYLDLYVSDAPIVIGAACLTGVFIVRDAYLGFAGDLMFVDTQSSDDPDYTGLGTRWQLVWLS